MRTFLIYSILLLTTTSFQNEPIKWQELEKGLDYISLTSPVASTIGDSRIEILRINPRYFKFELLCAGEKKTWSKVITEWCEEFDLIAGVNASMFKIEGNKKISSGFMKNYDYINNGVLTPSYQSVFAFNSVDTTLRDARIIDLTCEDWNQQKSKYYSFTQDIRMMDCHGKNVWKLSEKKWSMVVLGEDLEGNILFIFVRSPYRVAEYINILKGLPLRLKSLMYLEGGPEASLFINHPDLILKKMGSYESGFNENDDNDRFWEIPNIIGIRRR